MREALNAGLTQLRLRSGVGAFSGKDAAGEEVVDDHTLVDFA